MAQKYPADINSILAVIYFVLSYTKNNFVRKCRKQATYRHNLQILCQSREDNPLHTVAFNELIENLKEKNTTWSNTMLNCERSVSRTLFMDENSDRSH